MNLPDSIYQLQCLMILRLKGCAELREILRLPPNVVSVEAKNCVSLAIFLEEARRSHLLNMRNPPGPVNFLIQHDCPSSLRSLDLSGSAIVSLPSWLNEFVGLEELYLKDCKKLEEIPELPSNIKYVDARGCTSLERFQFNTVNDLRMLEWIDFSGCPGLDENMVDDLHVRLMSEVPFFHIMLVSVCLDFVGLIIEPLSYYM
jgi:Leucine-rich repeat (LRR) protein